MPYDEGYILTRAFLGGLFIAGVFAFTTVFLFRADATLGFLVGAIAFIVAFLPLAFSR